MSIPLESNKFYHVYNRANGNEKLFISNNNYIFFLNKYKKYINPVAYTYAFCLMPNHFHFLIKMKENSLETNSAKISKPFSNLFSSYTQSYNKLYKRKGSLFMKNFKRKAVDTEKYLKKIIHYIHLNPVAHGYTTNLLDWKFNSYCGIINNSIDWIERNEIISFFDNLENFIYVHESPLSETGI